jgi:hypothetical protein
MPHAMTIARKIRAWFGDYAGSPHSRYRSWEHCYCFFQDLNRVELADRRDDAALRLGFYLASWGMYRGSSFLLQHAYTVHLGVVDALADQRFAPLWEQEFGSEEDDRNRVPLVLEVIGAVREAYSQFGGPTDTLVTKVILGTLGCLPACDRYFLVGFKSRFKYSWVNRAFVERVLDFCLANLSELRGEQTKIRDRSGIQYPLMKLVDMYFHELGYEREARAARPGGTP